jgi:Rieske Fe-S protein
MTNSMISARILHDKITERKMNFPTYFSRTSGVKSVKALVKMSWRQRQDMQEKLQNAVPTCTQLGCNLNGMMRKKLGLPCHGSRFDENGKVLQGPAVRDLDLTDSN